MANFKTRALDRKEFELLINTIRQGFTMKDGKVVRPSERIATALVLEAQIGIRIGDITKLKLSDFIYENGRYHLDITEGKTNKPRTFMVPTEVYIYLSNYALKHGLKPNMRLFPIGVRAIQNTLHLACEYLGLSGVSTHSFRKMFANSIYLENDRDVVLVKELLQHSSLNVTQHYLSVDSKRIEQALQKHIILPT